MPKDLYEILGVNRNATQDEIRRAYLKLAHKYHPDKTGGDKDAEQKLKEVNAAYDVLKNPDKRTQYDQFGSTDGQPFGGGGAGFSGFGDFGMGFDSPFEDFFDVLFGQGGRRRGRGGARHGADLEYRMSITLEEAAFGARKKIRFPRMEMCSECNGSGAAAGSSPQACPQCGGAGQVRMAQGFFSVTRPCPDCGGSGRIITRPCGDCGGRGQVKTTREVTADVPAGVDTGSRLRLTGEGEPGRNGGQRGDLYILIEVQPHEIFQRDGTTVFCEAPVTFTEAALGATISVPTLEGSAELKIPAGTQSGNQLRLRGLGMPDLRGYRQGDQIVRVVVETPNKLSRKQKDLLQQLAESSDRRTYPKRARFEKQLERGKD